ncbi:pheromone processing endoprotease [Rhodotorula toruloides]
MARLASSPRSGTTLAASFAAALALVALFVCASAPPALAAKLQPAKRDYDSHVYYVLEVDEAQLAMGGPTPHEVAEALGAEHVEQVGELKGHYLIRAEAGEVERGEEQWELATAKALNGNEVRRRTVKGVEEGKRDKVLERYELLRRRLPGPASHLHAKRSLSSSHSPSPRLVRSLERQHPRQRVKRDLPVFPPSQPWSTKLRRRAFLPLLGERDPQQPGVGIVDATLGTGLIAAMASKFKIFDPLWSKQWHLVNGVMPENSINVTGVWEQGIVGKGVNVAIVDDGLDMHSDDLAANFHADGSWDYNDNTALPEPRLADDQHGTRCAGEIAAVKNDVCGVGVAHGAGIAGIRILSASISDADEASSLNYGYQTNDIYSCSWGPPDDGRSMEAPGRLIVKAMLNGVQNGRQGKGSIFVFASGNGGAVDDQCNFDGYTNSLMSITVGAIDRKGLHPFYSEACSANMVVTYSSGSGDNIHTTDVGKQTCTDRHGGTSAAAPIAAGIFALVLEVRPDLTWRDMQHLCVRTAVQINPNDPDWQMTASGRPYNHKYGFGKLDAYAIVEAAKTWKLVKPQAWWQSPLAYADKVNTHLGMPITADGVTAELAVTAQDLKAANLEKLEHVTITVFIEHQRRGDVEVELVSPKGMKSILARPRRFDESAEGMMGWVFMSVKHWDEDPVGTWTLRARDRQDNQKSGTFYRFAIQLWGSAIDAALAKPYQLAFEDEEGNEAEPEPVASTSVPAVAVGTTATNPSAPTKTYIKPTAHLPDDHAEATGEAHSSFGDGYHQPITTAQPAADKGDELDEIDYSLPPSPSATSTSGSLYDQTPGYLAGLSSLVGSTTWLFVAAGTIVIFIAGATAFLFLRRRSARRGGGGRGGYAFAPATDFEDFDEDDEDLVPMSAMERGGVSRTGGGARTRDLFNAFALNSDEEDDSGDEGQELVQHKREARRSAEEIEHAERGHVRFQDEPVDTPLTAAEQERRAREEFSD